MSGPGHPPAAGGDDLAFALAERERQLRDLTEQALGLLEELAETRRQNRDLRHFAARVGELEQQLDQARQRLRHSGGAVVGQRETTSPPLEIVHWGTGAAARALECRQRWPQLAVAWVGPPADVPVDLDPGSGVQWRVHRDARTPAQCWNLAMTATAAELVLFLGPDARLAEEPDPAAVGDSPRTLLLCPRLHDGQRSALGCEDADGLLTLRPRQLDALEQIAEPPPLPSPRAFAVRRIAFEKAGMFHEELLGSLALAEYALRGQQRGFEIVGLPVFAVRVADVGVELADAALDVDRLLVLAEHRPAALARALTDAEALWQRAQDAELGFLDQLLAHLPVDGEGGLRGLLQLLIRGLVQHAVPAARLRAEREASEQRREQAARELERLRQQLAELQQRGDRLEQDARQQQLAAEQREQQLELELQQVCAQQQSLAQQLQEQQREQQAVQHALQQARQLLRDMAPSGELLGTGDGLPQRAEALAAEVQGLVRLAAASAADLAAARQELHELRPRLADLQRVLAERERWIAALLREVRRRRLLPRPLLEHERAFLERTGELP